MANLYYNFSPAFVPGTKVRSDQVNTQYQAIETAFDLLPTQPTAITLGTATVGVESGAGSAYVVTMSPLRLSNAELDEVIFRSTHTNTGATTVDVDGIGAVPLVAADGSALLANDILTGISYIVRYDNANTRFQLVGPSTSLASNAAAAAASAAAALVSAGNAATSESNAATSETNAGVSAFDAMQWAVHPEDDDLDNFPGQFSSFHWAQKAMAAVGGSLSGLSDVDLTGQAQGDLLVNVDGTNWEDTGGNLTLNAGAFAWIGSTSTTGFQFFNNGSEIMEIRPRDGASFLSSRFIRYHNDDNQWTIQGSTRVTLFSGTDTFSMGASMPLVMAPATAAFVPLRFNTLGSARPTSALNAGLFAVGTNGELGVWGVAGQVPHNLSFIAPNALVYQFDTDTNTATIPGLNDWKMNNATPASVTEIAINDTMLTGGDFGTYWGANLTTGDKIFIKQQNDESRYIVLSVSGALIDGTGFWRIPVTVDDSGLVFSATETCSVQINAAITGASSGGVSISGTPVNNQFAIWTDASTIEGESDLTYNGAGVMALDDGSSGFVRLELDGGDAGSARVQAAFGGGSDAGFYIENNDAGAGGGAMILDNGTGRLALQQTSDAGSLQDLWVNCQRNGAVQLYNNGTQMFDTTVSGVRVQGSLFMDEQAAAAADVAGDGQFWVRDDAPNVPMFANDVGDEFVLGQTVSVYKTVNTVRSSTVTKTVDPDLALSLTPGLWLINWDITWGETGGASQGLRFDWRATGGTSVNFSYEGVWGPGNATPTAAEIFVGVSSGNNNLIAGDTTQRRMFGTIRLEVTATTSVELFWAQVISDVNATDILAGSLMHATKIG